MPKDALPPIRLSTILSLFGASVATTKQSRMAPITTFAPTTIQPATGAGILFTQQGVGTAPGYGAIDDRRANNGSLQAGVYGTSALVTAGGVSNVGQADFMVTQRNAGANMSVDVNMPAGGSAYVQGTTINGQGLYTIPVHAISINEIIAPADPSSPRVDQIILEIQDNAVDGSAGNQARTRVLTGTPSAGATLTNRLGAPALPGNALLLADVLVGAAATTVPNTVIRDRRKWARGALWRTVITAGNYSPPVSASYAALDTTRLQARIECSGVLLRVTARCRLDTSGGAWVLLAPLIDGVVPTEFGTAADIQGFTTASGAATVASTFSWDIAASAGSHLVSLAAKSITSVGTVEAGAANALIFTVEEVVRQNAANNTVTSG